MSLPPVASPWRRLLDGRVVGSTALLVVFVAVCVGLGSWQLDGWRAQRAAAEQDLSTRTPVPLLDVIGADDPFPGDAVSRPVTVSGAWIPDSGFLVGPRERRGRDGWWAMGIARLDGAATSVPVVIGWVARPETPAVSGPVETVGLLQPGEGSFAPDEDPTDRIFPEVRLASLTQLVPEDLVSAFVVARTVSPAPDLGQRSAAVTPEEVPAVGVSTALRNLLYALQWWILALGALIVWGRFVRDELRTPRGRFDG